MGRLTKRTHAGVKCAYDPFKCEDQYEDGGCGYCVHMLAMMGKLAAYEELEEQSLLLRLPCKVGTPVWTIMCGMNGKNPTLFRQDFELSMIQHWGKAVFLTKEEAEKALAERGKG